MNKLHQIVSLSVPGLQLVHHEPGRRGPHRGRDRHAHQRRLRDDGRLASRSGGVSVLAVGGLHGVHGVHLQPGDPVAGPLLVDHGALAVSAAADAAPRPRHDRGVVGGGDGLAAAGAGVAPPDDGGERLHPPHVCETEFSNSAAFKAVTAALNFYLPTALMLYLYCRIFKEIKTRQALGRVNFSNHDLPTDSCSEAEKGPRPRSRSAGRSPRAHASSSSPRRSGDRAAAAAASASAPAAEGPRSHFQSLTVVSPGRHDCSHFSGVTVSVEYLPDDADPDSPAAARRSYSGRHLALQQQQEAAEEEEDAYQYQRRQGGGARLGPHHNHIHCYQSSSRPHPSWHPSPPAAGTWGGAGGRGNNARHPREGGAAAGRDRGLLHDVLGAVLHAVPHHGAVRDVRACARAHGHHLAGLPQLGAQPGPVPAVQPQLPARLRPHAAPPEPPAQQPLPTARRHHHHQALTPPPARARALQRKAAGFYLNKTGPELKHNNAKVARRFAELSELSHSLRTLSGPSAGARPLGARPLGQNCEGRVGKRDTGDRPPLAPGLETSRPAGSFTAHPFPEFVDGNRSWDSFFLAN
ncbi:Histamine H1 receptor [Penaeus vannamei]|uniref:Histamine H1 receptor n=1 Tax=Penaeus vannamei TaxID=6689 RepID=A0A3R7QMB9_PENVA|nr:Histamine H1 receptor [Penaeus vannamei]